MVSCVSLAPLVVSAVLAVGSAPSASRGNTVLVRDTKKPVYSLAAAARLGILVGRGAEVIQPVGFGFGLQFRFHGLRVGPTRFGLEFHGGHMRFMEKRMVIAPDEQGGDKKVTRWAALGHTDFTLGPSIQIPIKPLIIEVGAGAGVAISTFVRPFGPHVTDEEQVNDAAAMIRAGGHLGVPIRNNQGIVLGSTFWEIFSDTQVVADPETAGPDAEPDTSVFDLVVEVYLAYQMWF
jgi:hypothetical protein